MRAMYSLTHLADSTLSHGLTSRIARECTGTAELLAWIAEFDARKLYLPAGYPSMQAYCVEGLHLSEDAANKRIRAARTARRFPLLFVALAAGELHLAAIVMLGSHLTDSNVQGLVDAARHRSKAEIGEMLAARFPRPDLPEVLGPVADATGTPGSQVAPGPPATPKSLSQDGLEFASGLQPANSGARTTPLSAERSALQLTISRVTHDKIEYAKALLSHRLRPDDLAGLVDRAFDSVIAELEKQRFAARSGPRRSHGNANRGASNPRTTPAYVKRSVWLRDRGRCTFVGANGHICGSRMRLEFDHIEPIARGGASSVSNLRLRCRAHNQYEAERLFGAGFVQGKRERARRDMPAARVENPRVEETRTAARSGGGRSNQAGGVATDLERDLVACLRQLGYRNDEIRRAVDRCPTASDATLEQCVRIALHTLRPKTRTCDYRGMTPVAAAWRGGTSSVSNLQVFDRRPAGSPAAPR